MIDKSYKFFGKTVNTYTERFLHTIFGILKFNFDIGNYQVSGFEYAPDVYFILEFDFNLSGYGSYSVKESYIEYERSVIHAVLFRNKFSVRKTWRVAK